MTRMATLPSRLAQMAEATGGALPRTWSAIRNHMKTMVHVPTSPVAANLHTHTTAPIRPPKTFPQTTNHPKCSE